MNSIKKTPTRLKFSGMTFIHNSKADVTNAFLKESAVINGIKYFRMKDPNALDLVTEKEVAEGFVATTITIPTAEEIAALEKKDLVVDEEGNLQAVKQEDKPKILEHPSGKKMKRRFLNPKTGNYVSYIRAIQLKLVSEYSK